MKSFRLNQDGDLELDEDGNLRFVDGVKELKQRIRISLKTNLNEWFLDTTLGVNWHEILDKFDDKVSRIQLEVRRILNDFDEILEVIEIDVDFSRANRLLKLKFKALLSGGEEISDEVEVI